MSVRRTCWSIKLSEKDSLVMKIWKRWLGGCAFWSYRSYGDDGWTECDAKKVNKSL